uniref:Uncharacterized protein n=1 Tax=Siphoviridae sp. ctnpt50 TaxID=2827941 RepID=A0A8S5SDJ7_9CAUD|nr:MAG TPA: hypothetical protein [Siphoviridae sp. ctnpt50]
MWNNPSHRFPTQLSDLIEAGALEYYRSAEFIPLAVDVGAAPTRSVPKTDGLLLSQSTMFRLWRLSRPFNPTLGHRVQQLIKLLFCGKRYARRRNGC